MWSQRFDSPTSARSAKRGAELFAGIEDSELIEGYEEELVRPLADAARVGRAVYVGTDT